ncbi:MAG: FG-GAP-like repeat-containing protein, partial [Promethearchaeota archaeon]
MKIPIRKLTFVFLISLVVMLGQFVVFSESATQPPPQKWSDLYLPQYPEVNETLAYSSSLHEAGFPVVMYDLSGDGVPEILFGSDDGEFYVWNASNNNYAPIWNDNIASLNPTVASKYEIFSVAVGDMDTNTSSLEILVGTVNYITVLTWNGTSCVYNRTVQLAVGGSDMIVSSLIVEDIDNDSYNEIIAAIGRKTNYADNVTSHSGKMFVWKATDFRDNPGDWKQIDATDLNRIKTNWYTNRGCYSLITGDPDNDNKTEIIAHLEYLGVGCTVIINSSTYIDESIISAPEGRGYGLACGDIDNDGDNELAIGDGDGTVYIMSGAGSSYSTSKPILIPGASLVWGLKIADSDNDTRNELIATTLQGDLRIFQWDSSFNELKEEDTSIEWIGAQVGAFNFICVGDPDNDSWTELALGKAGPNSGFGVSDYDSKGHLHVFGYIPTWANVTAPPPSTIQAATPIIFNAQYNRTDSSEGIPGLQQVVGIDNDTQTLWEGGSPSFIDEGSGNYTIELPTTGVEPGYHAVRVILFEVEFEPGEVFVNFTVSGADTNVTVLWGAANLSGYWETYGAFSPYVNSTDKGIAIFYSYNSSGTPTGIIGARGRASLLDLNGTMIGGKEQLPWYDLFELYGGNVSYRGIYYIQLDTYGLHVADFNLTITVWKEKYNPAELWVIVHVEPIPSSLVAVGEEISIYEGGDFEVSVFFRDDYHLKDVSNGAVSLTITNGTWNWGNYVYLSYETFGLYKSEEIKLEDIGITSGTYSIIINGSAPDYEDCQTSLPFAVNLKANVVLILSQLPSEIMAGESLPVEATLTFENGTAVINQDVKFTYTYDGLPHDGPTVVTDENGKASITITPPAGTTRVEISVRYDGSEETNPITSVASTAAGGTFVRIVTIWDRMIEMLPFAGIGAAVVGGSAFSFHRFVRVPKRRRKLEELNRIAETFDNFENLRHIIVLEKNSGLTIYDQSFTGTNLDPSLVSGFIQAISSFGAELTKKADGKLRELTYEGFRLLLDEGDY